MTHLVHRYGTRAPEIVALVAADPEARRRIVPELSYRRAEVTHAGAAEMAATLDDMLRRRVAARVPRCVTAAFAVSDDVANLMRTVLGWSAEETAARDRLLPRRRRARACAPRPRSGDSCGRRRATTACLNRAGDDGSCGFRPTTPAAPHGTRRRIARAAARRGRGAVARALADAYPDAWCALRHENAWQLLVATILSAQCTDERVNMVTPALFTRYPTPAAMAAAPAAELESMISVDPDSSARRRRH